MRLCQWPKIFNRLKHLKNATKPVTGRKGSGYNCLLFVKKLMFYKKYFKNKHIFVNEKIIEFSRKKKQFVGLSPLATNFRWWKFHQVARYVWAWGRAWAQGLGPKVFVSLPPENAKSLNLYRPQRSCGKVMFLHLSVSHSIHGGGVCHTSPRAYWADTPPDRHTPLRSACWDTVNKQVVRILVLTAIRVWVSPPLKLHSFSSKTIIHRSLPPPKILGQKAKNNH